MGCISCCVVILLCIASWGALFRSCFYPLNLFSLLCALYFRKTCCIIMMEMRKEKNNISFQYKTSIAQRGEDKKNKSIPLGYSLDLKSAVCLFMTEYMSSHARKGYIMTNVRFFSLFAPKRHERRFYALLLLSLKPHLDDINPHRNANIMHGSIKKIKPPSPGHHPTRTPSDSFSFGKTDQSSNSPG